jgi:uncharacterized lipoprotein
VNKKFKCPTFGIFENEMKTTTRLEGFENTDYIWTDERSEMRRRTSDSKKNLISSFEEELSRTLGHKHSEYLRQMGAEIQDESLGRRG